MRADEMLNLLHSPQWIAKLLHQFLSGASSINKNGIKLELIYFALPFVFDEAIQKKLCTSNTRSTFTSVFNNNDLKNQLIGMDDKINDFKKITNKGLIYLGNLTEMYISEYISVSDKMKYSNESNPVIKEYCKAAYNWGIILSKADYRNLFIKVGVTNI